MIKPLEEKSYLEKLNSRLNAVNILREVKERFSYKELSKKTNIPSTVLNRYVRGHLIPSYKRAINIISMFSSNIISDLERDIKLELTSKFSFNNEGFFDNTRLISDSSLLRKLGELIQKKYSNIKIDKVITAAVDGIPIATHVANSLNVPILIGKYNKEIGVDEFYESTLSIESAGILMTMFLPKKLLKKGDKVLIVDDVIRSGQTQKLLVDLIKKAHADIVGFFILVAIGLKWKKNIIMDNKLTQDILIQL